MEMDYKLSIRNKMTEKQKQLEAMVGLERSLTHPAVVALSQEIDHLVLLLTVGQIPPMEVE